MTLVELLIPTVSYNTEVAVAFFFSGSLLQNLLHMVVVGNVLVVPLVIALVIPALVMVHVHPTHPLLAHLGLVHDAAYRSRQGIQAAREKLQVLRLRKPDLDRAIADVHARESGQGLGCLFLVQEVSETIPPRLALGISLNFAVQYRAKEGEDILQTLTFDRKVDTLQVQPASRMERFPNCLHRAHEETPCCLASDTTEVDHADSLLCCLRSRIIDDSGSPRHLIDVLQASDFAVKAKEIPNILLLQLRYHVTAENCRAG